MEYFFHLAKYHNLCLLNNVNLDTNKEPIYIVYI